MVGAVVGGWVEKGFTVVVGTALGEGVAEAGTDVGVASGATVGLGSRNAGGTIASTAGTASPSVPRAVGGIGTKAEDEAE
jgi:hypothetical protein